MNSKELDIIRGVVDATPDVHIPNFNSIFDKDHSGLGTVPEIPGPTPGPTPGGGDDEGGGAALSGIFSPFVEVGDLSIMLNPVWYDEAQGITQQSTIASAKSMANNILNYGGGFVFYIMPSYDATADDVVEALRKVKMHVYMSMLLEGTDTIDTSDLKLGVYRSNVEQITIPTDSEIVGDVAVISDFDGEGNPAVGGCVRYDFTLYSVVETLMTVTGGAMGDIISGLYELRILVANASGPVQVSYCLPNFEITE